MPYATLHFQKCKVELDRLFPLYEDKVTERITGWNFEMISGRYQKEQLEIEAWLREVTKTLNEKSALGT